MEGHVVITGASAGIGAALARRFAGLGARLTLVARSADRLADLARALDTACRPVTADLSDLDQAAAWLPAAVEALGPVDVLVNNAGVQVLGRTDDVDLALAEASLTVNLASPLRLIHAVLPSMRQRGRGVVVNIASMAALAPTPGMTWYNAGKGGLAAASEALRGELRGTGVDVITVYPGIIDDTDMGRTGLAHYRADAHLALRLQPRGTADGLAKVISRAIEGRRARVIWPRSNALARYFPAPTRWLLDRLTPSAPPT